MPSIRAFGLSAILLLGMDAAGATDWLETRVEIEELAEAGEFELAIARGDEYLEQIEEAFGADSQELADAYQLLAGIHRQSRNFEDAELAQLRAIEILEGLNGRSSISLIEPLITLGNTYQASAQYDLSLAVYEEARSIGRRIYGLLNQDQLEIIDRMTASVLAKGDREGAQNLQRDALAIVQRYYGAESLESVNASFDHAKWLIQQFATTDAMRAYLDISDLIENNFDDQPLQKIRLLQSAADFLRNAGSGVLRMRTSPDELELALEIARSFDMQDPRLEAEILRDIGDWYVSLSLDRKIAEPYLESWEMLSQLPDGDRIREEWFSGRLVMVRNAGIISRFLSSAPDAPWGRLELSFTLDAFGRPSGIEVIHSDPPGLLDGAAMNQIGSARFRPRMTNGKPVASNGVVGWDFQYQPNWAEFFSGGPAAPPDTTGGSGIWPGRSGGSGGGGAAQPPPADTVPF